MGQRPCALEPQFPRSVAFLCRAHPMTRWLPTIDFAAGDSASQQNHRLHRPGRAVEVISPIALLLLLLAIPLRRGLGPGNGVIINSTAPPPASFLAHQKTASSQQSGTARATSIELAAQLRMRGHCSSVLKRRLRAVLQDGKTQWPRRYGTVAESPSLTTPRSSVLDDALNATSLRNTWTKDEIRQIYETPLMKLAYAAVSRFFEQGNASDSCRLRY